jgi:hypothetical protein
LIRFLASLWLRYLYPIWNAVPSTIQACLSSDLKPRGRMALRQLEDLAPNWARVTAKMTDLRFKWSEAPMGGVFSFRQKPWITAATGEGGCDDWAFLWRELAKSFGDVSTFVAKEKGRGRHMMTILDDGTTSWLFSNLRCVRSTASGNRKALETTLLGYDKTAYVVYLR